jgi:hypothetical protein
LIHPLAWRMLPLWAMTACRRWPEDISPESFTRGSPRSVPIGSVAALSPEISSPAHFRRVRTANRANPGLTLLTPIRPRNPN